MKKNKYYDYAFNIAGYPNECADILADSLVFNWKVDFSGVAIIPYKTGFRTVRMEKPLNPTWDNDGLFASKSIRSKTNLIGLLGEFVILDMLEQTGLTMGDDLRSLNYRINPDSPAKSWGVNIPDIEIVDDLDREYIEVKSSINNKITLDLRKYNQAVKWCSLNWHEGDLKVVGVEFLELPVYSDYDIVLAFRNAYIFPDRSSNGLRFSTFSFSNFRKINNPKFIPGLQMGDISNLTNISDIITK